MRETIIKIAYTCTWRNNTRSLFLLLPLVHTVFWSELSFFLCAIPTPFLWIIHLHLNLCKVGLLILIHFKFFNIGICSRNPFLRLFRFGLQSRLASQYHFNARCIRNICWDIQFSDTSQACTFFISWSMVLIEGMGLWKLVYFVMPTCIFNIAFKYTVHENKRIFVCCMPEVKMCTYMHMCKNTWWLMFKA